MLIALSETRALLFAHLAFESFSASIQVHMWRLVLFSLSLQAQERSAGTAVCFLSVFGLFPVFLFKDTKFS